MGRGMFPTPRFQYLVLKIKTVMGEKVIYLWKVLVPFPNSDKPSMTYEKLHCKGNPISSAVSEVLWYRSTYIHTSCYFNNVLKVGYAGYLMSVDNRVILQI